ncbi:MAG: rhodanese-like domain-containing protein [Nibricoccus sp.]
MSHILSDASLQQIQLAKSRITQVPPDWAISLVQNGAVLIDVREREEFEKAHLPGAINISRSVLADHITSLVPNTATPVVCYCAGGNRGALATDALQQLGYKNVVSIQGGLNACALPAS